MHIIASNRDTKNRLRGWIAPAFWNNVTVAHTAIDPTQTEAAYLSEGEASELRRRYSIPEDRTVVLAVGQFVDRKGRWIFMEAASQLLKAANDLYFVWLTPKLPDAVEKDRIDSYGVNESMRIVLSQTVGRDRMDVLRFFNVADIFALPSYIEGLPIALLEAMAIGIPAISTNVFAIPEAVIDMETGLLIEAGSSDHLAAAILKLKNDPELRRRLGKAGKAHVIQNFDERDAARCIVPWRGMARRVAPTTRVNATVAVRLAPPPDRRSVLAAGFARARLRRDRRPDLQHRRLARLVCRPSAPDAGPLPGAVAHAGR
jgi:glycosyltransferase involved in cell wall biosynthesis